MGISEVLKGEFDFWDVFCEKRWGYSIFFTLSKVKERKEGFISGVGVRKVKGDFVDFVSLEPENAFKFLEENNFFFDFKIHEDFFYPDFEKFLFKLDSQLREKGKDKIENIEMSFSVSSGDFGIFSDISRVRFSRKKALFNINVFTEKNGEKESFHEFVFSEKVDDRFFKKAEEKAFYALRIAEELLDAKFSPQGVYPVIISPEAGGTFIHEVIGHSLEADAVRKGISPVYSGKIGEKVASEKVTVIDDPAIKGKFGSFKYDDEGVPAQKVVLIEKGILKDYLYDRKEALFARRKSNGHGRRQAYDFAPIPRMGITFLDKGESTAEEIFKKVKKGIFVKKMGGGQVNPANGDFVFEVQEGYLIEGGKIGPLLKKATLLGNGPEILERINHIGGEVGWADGVCGKSGQGVPVSDGMPLTLIPEIVIGGRGE